MRIQTQLLPLHTSFLSEPIFPTCRVTRKLQQAQWWAAAEKYPWDPLLFISLKPELPPPQGRALPRTLSWWNKVNAEVSLSCTFHRPHDRCYVHASECRPRLTVCIVICLSSQEIEREGSYWWSTQLASIRYRLSVFPGLSDSYHVQRRRVIRPQGRRRRG